MTHTHPLSPADTDLPTLQNTPPGLYRHYKGGYYQVQQTVRCSETLQGMTIYRALYGEAEYWVRPSSMFAETVAGPSGHAVPRFIRVDEATLALNDLDTARAMVLSLHTRLHAAGGGTTFRRPPSEPTTCCGRGCSGCVWEAYFGALHHWRNDLLEVLEPNSALAQTRSSAGPQDGPADAR